MRLFTFSISIFAFLFFANFANAELTFTEGSISGVSYFDLAEKRIYGGVAGLCSSPSTSSTCDTCTDTTGGLKPCNRSAIHSTLTINFTFKSSVNLVGKKVYLKVGNTGALGKQNLTDIPGQAENTNYTIQTTWGQFCLKAAALPVTGLNSDCSLGGASDVYSTGVSFYIGEDTVTDIEIPVTFHGIPYEATPPYHYPNLNQSFGDSSGVYGLYKYVFRAGDSKLILQEGENTFLSSVMPTGTPDLYAIAYFLDIQDTPTNLVDTSLFANGKNTITVHKYDKTNSKLSDGPYIEGLSNGSQYCVVTGQMNKAQNIFAFTTANVNSTMACATPNLVIGILEDKKCFISTAAFGSDMADEVVLFRKFRDLVLLKTSGGKWFVKNYYKYSPPLANFIARSEVLRAAARGGLYPILGFAWLSLQIGTMPALFFALLVLIGAFKLRKKLRWSFGK